VTVLIVEEETVADRALWNTKSTGSITVHNIDETPASIGAALDHTILKSST
jgi:hypothetical protein